MTTGLQGDVGCRTFWISRALLKCINLSMLIAKSTVPTFRDHLIGLNKNATDHWIGFDRSLPSLGEFEGSKHPLAITHGDVLNFDFKPIQTDADNPLAGVLQSSVESKVHPANRNGLK